MRCAYYALRGTRADGTRHGRTNSLFPITPLAALVAFLPLHRQGRDRPRFQAPDRNRLAGLLAIAIGAVLDARERSLDLGDQLALAVARPQLDGPGGLGRRPVGEIGVILVLVLKVLEGFLRLLENILLPRQQLLAEVVPLALVHERLLIGRPIGLALLRPHALRLP